MTVDLVISKNKLYLLETIYAITIVVAFYSFGAFGFFNLFWMRLVFQFSVALFSIFGVLAVFFHLNQYLQNKRNPLLYIILSILGLLYYGMVYAVIVEDFLGGIIQSVLACIIVLFILFTRTKLIIFISKCIVVISFFFTLLGYIAYVGLLIDPTTNYNLILYDSTISNEQIFPASWLEYFSFTSGDGYSFFGIQVTRLKGFCSEPSATIVHYLAPACIAFLYSKKYKIMGYIMLMFNVLAISSVVGLIIIFGSVFLYYIFLMRSNKGMYFIIGCVLLIGLTLMLNVSLAESILLDFGRNIFEATSYDLISRKEGSLTVRLISFGIALQEIISNPLGWSNYSTMTGLLTNAGLKGGVLLILILIVFGVKLFNYGFLIFQSKDKKNKQSRIGGSLLISCVFVTYLISGYGWDRLPGVIMLMLFYRNLQNLILDK